ncbi:hypothetical protein GUJ93_ZPchr0005g16233 [Zizania palustris]|uniref:Uncharacterized protein n=1 Tax=Zizania palustris TaxID=103762 RepID=A0A8J5VF73_ZIZPA|nr:hypothetical protein GUJ93_ZPchr0005g16233 [Zizania palustris]
MPRDPKAKRCTPGVDAAASSLPPAINLTPRHLPPLQAPPLQESKAPGAWRTGTFSSTAPDLQSSLQVQDATSGPSSGTVKVTTRNATES